MICDLCRPEPHEVFSRTSVINRGITRVGHLINCVGLTPLCFPCTLDDILKIESSFIIIELTSVLMKFLIKTLT